MWKNVREGLSTAGNVIYRICQVIIIIAAVAVTGFLTVLNLLFSSRIEYTWLETLTLSRTTWIAIVAAIAMLVLLVLLQKIAPRISENYLFLILAAAYLVVGIYWIFHIDTTLRMDPDVVHTAAVKAAAGDFSFLDPAEDIYKHLHQLGMVTYERVLGIINHSVRVVYFFNLLEIIGINFLTWRLANLCFGGSQRVNVTTIVCAFFFLPQFFFLAFAYGTIPGFFFLMCAFYAQQKLFRGSGKRNWLWLVVCAVAVAAAVAVKQNYLVGAIAIAILFVMQAFRGYRPMSVGRVAQREHGARKERGAQKERSVQMKRSAKKMRVARNGRALPGKEEKRVQPRRLWRVWQLVGAVIVLVCAFGVGKVLVAAYETESGMNLGDSEPYILYVAMGIDPTSDSKPGWYNGYNDWAFEEAGMDADAATEIAKNSIKDAIFTFEGHPDYARQYFGDKMKSLWCDPMFQSLQSGPLEDAGQEVYSPWIAALYSGGTADQVIETIMKGFLIVLLALAFVSALTGQNWRYHCDYVYLYLIGGFLLHIVWEAKSQYVYMYIFILIPCCAKALEDIWGVVSGKVAGQHKRSAA